MKRMAIAALGSIFALASGTPADASQAQYGYISEPIPTSNGAVLFNTNGTRTTPPSCGAGLPLRFAINASTANGQAQLSVLMMAYAQHKRINIVGLGVCNIWGDTETVDYFSIEG